MFVRMLPSLFQCRDVLKCQLRIWAPCCRYNRGAVQSHPMREHSNGVMFRFIVSALATSVGCGSTPCASIYAAQDIDYRLGP